MTKAQGNGLALHLVKAGAVNGTLFAHRPDAPLSVV